MRRSSWVILAIAASALLLLAGRALTALVVDNAWFAALNAEPVFWEEFKNTLALRGGLLVAGSVFAFLNLYTVRRTILAIAVPSRVGNVEFTAMLPTRRLFTYTVIAAVLVGLLLVTPFDDWTVLSMARRGIPFNESEFYFQRDLGHYVYWLPLEQTLYIWALLATVVMVAMVIVLYAITRSLKMDGRRISATTHARRHLTVLGSLMLLLLAWSYRLDGYDLMRFGTGNDGLFLRIDHLVAVKLDFGLCILTIFAAMLLLRAGWAGQFRMATFALTIVLLAAIGVRHGVPFVLTRSSVLGQQARRELDYISTRALFTRRAYDVDGMAVVHSDTSSRRVSGLQLSDLPRVLSVWDAAPLARAMGVNTAGRTALGPVTWSPSDGELQGLLLQRPATGDGPWTLSRVLGSVADDRGGPVHDGFGIDDPIDSASINMADDVSVGVIGAPLIAPGATGHRLIIDSTTRIVGARLDSDGSRIAHAWATRDPRLLSGDPLGAVPTLVMWRDVRERVRKLAPVFAQGQDIIPLVHEGALMWAIELYSASDMYPLAQRFQLAGSVRSYFRHSATAIVHSRTGRVRLVAVDKPDPVARTWMTIAPNLFVQPSTLSQGLLEQLPPPSDGTVAQMRAFSRYGSRLEGSASRHVPDSIMGSDPPAMLLDGRSAAVGWAVPMLNGPEQVAGLIVSSGGARRGSVWMPVSELGARWGGLREQLRTALDSSRQQLMMDGVRREPQTTFGRVRTVLINGKPAAIQPLYVTRLNQSQALARVAVTYEDKVGVGASLGEAVRQLQGPLAPGGSNNGAGASSVPLTTATRQATVNRLYDSMRAAMRRGDWTRFGLAFDSLGVLLGRPPQ